MTCSHIPLTSLLLVHFMNENTDKIEGEGHTGTSSQLEFESLSLSYQPCSFRSLTADFMSLHNGKSPKFKNGDFEIFRFNLERTGIRTNLYIR